MSITTNILNLNKEIPADVVLIAVSKTKPVYALKEAFDTGQRHFGENKVQEMIDKQTQMSHEICWHMIGHVQRNKVKYMASFVHLIHGVDNLPLLMEINKQGHKNNRVIDCLLQIKIAQEETKFGLNAEAATDILESEAYMAMTNVRIVGLMGMASFTSNRAQINKEFEFLKVTFDRCIGIDQNIKILSMGMSSDYDLAISCGSNMVRVGSKIFGERQ